MTAVFRDGADPPADDATRTVIHQAHRAALASSLEFVEQAAIRTRVGDGSTTTVTMDLYGHLFSEATWQGDEPTAGDTAHAGDQGDRGAGRRRLKPVARRPAASCSNCRHPLLEFDLGLWITR